MEWVIMEPGGFQGLSSNLGSFVNGTYIPADDCEEILGEMLQFLSKEDVGLRVRRRMGLEGVVKKDLVPLLKCEAVQSDFEILRKSIKFLANLTQPIECMATKETLSGGSFNQQLLLDLNRMLQEAREACQDHSFMSSLATAMTNVLESSMGEMLQDVETKMLNRCVLLLRNLMYIPFSRGHNQDDASSVNPILRNILECGVDKILLKLLNHEQRDCWCTALIQLISLMFKDHTDIWFTGDDVSSWDSVSMMSELSGSDINLLEREMGAVDITDSSSQGQSASDSGEEGAEARKDRHQPGPSQTSTLDLSGSDLDSSSSSSNLHSNIVDALKLFACEFIKTAFTKLTNSLMCALLSQSQHVLDSTYFMWSLAFFLKFARYMNIELEHYKMVLSHEVLGFLVFEGLKNCETIMLKQLKNTWCPIAHRRLHLIMSALSQLFKTILANVDNAKADQEFLVNIQKSLAQMADLRQLFLLLMRQHQTHLQGQFYLRDVVETNHLYLLLLERWITAGYCPSQFNMLAHVKQFATPEIMQKYGLLLENFKFNRKNLNHCVLTMMYHVAGDCNRCDVLMQLPILKTFTEIWDSNLPLLQEYNDLMEFVLENFMTMAGKDPNTCALNLFGMREQVSREVTREVESHDAKARCQWIAEEVNLVPRAAQQQRSLQASVWTAEEEDLLLGWLLELQDSAGIVQIITDRFQEMGIAKSRLEVISAIEKSGWLNESQLMELSTEVESIRQSELSQRESILRELSGIPRKMLLPHLVEQVKKQGHEAHLAWLQHQLLEVAYVKLVFKGVAPRGTVEEPVARYFTMQNKSVPLMVSTEDQEMALHDVYFYVLLHGLGLFQADDVNTAFIRIPNFWTPMQLLEKARQLGDLPGNIKFEVELVQEEEDPIFEQRSQTVHTLPPEDTQSCTAFRPTHRKSHISDHMWLNYVQECNQKHADAANEKLNRLADLKCQSKLITAVSSCNMSSRMIHPSMETAE